MLHILSNINLFPKADDVPRRLHFNHSVLHVLAIWLWWRLSQYGKVSVTANGAPKSRVKCAISEANVDLTHFQLVREMYWHDQTQSGPRRSDDSSAKWLMGNVVITAPPNTANRGVELHIPKDNMCYRGPRGRKRSISSAHFKLRCWKNGKSVNHNQFLKQK